MKLRDAIIVFLLFVVYIVFPSSNPTTDSWYYASCVKYGSDLFLPHHLLYNAFNYYLFEILQSFRIHIDALSYMQALNAAFASFSLLVFQRILLISKLDKSQTAGFILMAGSSFVFVRFATENETYLLPLFLSLLSTYFYLSDKKRKKYALVLSGLLASLACLFHQIHFFWWLAILFTIVLYRRNFRSFFQFLIPALLVPIVYYSVLVFIRNESGFQALMQFVFYEYYQGVSTSFSIDYLKFGIISFIRSFIQLHGNIVSLIINNWLFIVPALLAFACFILGVSRKQFVKRKKSVKAEYVMLFLFIFILQLSFAVYSYGNAEFMLMLPMILLLIIASLTSINSKSLYWIGASLLIWNMAYAIVPNNKMQLNADEFLSSKLMEQENDLFIIQNSQRLENSIYYQQAYYPANIIRSPFSYNERGKNLDSLRALINDGLGKSKSIYTDCLNSVPLDRSFILSEEENNAFFKEYKISKADSVLLLDNMYYLFQISR